MMLMLKRPAKVHPLVEAASEYIGYTCKPGDQSTFGAQTNTNGLSWDGAFVDVVSRDAGLLLPACVYTPAALAAYTRANKTFHVPKPGDIVFFAFPAGTASELDAPHVGIVTDTTAWKKYRAFKTVEAQVNTGVPRGSQEHNGVYERVRYETDIICFARPALRRRGTTASLEGLPTVLPAHLTTCATAAKSASATDVIRNGVVLVQTALAAEVGLQEAERAVFNAKTQSALAAFQRNIGYVNPLGVPDNHTLAELARRQPLFTTPE